jgi:DNA-binding response OmpR family regulator
MISAMPGDCKPTAAALQRAQIPDNLTDNDAPTPLRSETTLSLVLLVDDEVDYVETLAERLCMRGFDAEVVHSGEAALELLARRAVGVVVLDLRMPGIGGMETLRRLRPAHPGVAVVILTGHGNEKDEQAALEQGAYAYLQKPVDIDALARTIRQAEQRGADER